MTMTGHSSYQPPHGRTLFSLSPPSPRPGQPTGTSRQTLNHRGVTVRHLSLLTAAQFCPADMTGRADDDKCRGEKAITESVRCSRDSGRSLPTDCGVVGGGAHPPCINCNNKHTYKVVFSSFFPLIFPFIQAQVLL